MFDARGQRVGMTVHIIDGSGASEIAYRYDDDPNGLWSRSGIEQPLAPRRSTQGKSVGRGTRQMGCLGASSKRTPRLR
jgi:hypothetical protein